VLSFTGSEVTVAPAVLTVTAGDASKVYGADLPAFTVTYSGFVNGEDESRLTARATVGTAADASSPAGAYALSPSGASAPNYTVHYVDGTLTVTPAVLTVAAGPQAFAYGGAPPVLTFSASGLVNGDALDAVLSGAPATSATSASHVGTYPITPGTLATNANYALEFTGSDVRINPAPLTVTADPLAFVYGATLPALTYHAAGLVNGDTAGAVLSGAPATSATSASHVGTYPITEGTLAASGNYVLSFIPANVSVTPAPLTITANAASKVFGAPLPGLTASLGGLVHGDTAASLTTPPVLTTTATATSPVGVYGIDVAGASSPDYAITFVPATLAVTRAGTTSELGTSLNMAVVGQDSTYTVQLAPANPGAGTPTGMVTFSSDGAPIGTAPVDGSGRATLFVSTLDRGTHTITASYSGDANFQASQSNAVQALVSAAGTRSLLTVQAVRNKRGKVTAVKLLSRVLALTPGTGVPAGVVAYLRNGKSFGTASSRDGTAVIQLKPKQALKQTFSVQYSGGGNFAGSTSAPVKVTQGLLK
jgi:hypothetical protein